MLKALQHFFDVHILTGDEADGASDPDQALRLATASLLIEMTRADDTISPEEQASVLRNLRRVFGLSEEQTRDLVETARREADKATSLYPFTGLINQHFSPEQKAQVVEALWRVAYADGTLDKYEEHLVRKVAELIHVSHSTFIRTKLKAKQRLES